MSTWYGLSGKEVMKQLDTTPEGLGEHEAQARLERYGENVLKESGRKKTWQVFAEQFQDLLVMILIGAAVLSMLSGNVESTIVIFAVIVLNAVLGTVQYEKARKSLDSLKALSSPAAKGYRDGKKMEFHSSQVVPGDIMVLETGDMVVADGRLLESHSLQVNESSLTGEAAQVEKQDRELKQREISLADQTNMVFSGSLVTGGRAVAVVTATGMDTEIGKIASLMNGTEEGKTPLQISLDRFSSHLAVGILLICGVVFGLSLYRRMPVLDSLMFAVALAVAAIPEALGSIVTIVQAMGTQKMAGENAIIKELKAVESLGCVSVICTDKTGTLTQNKMEVCQVYISQKMEEPKQLDLKNPVHEKFLQAAVLANDAVVSEKKKGEGNSLASVSVIGDPTETALLELGMHWKTEVKRWRAGLPRIGELPFDSGRKLMSTLHKTEKDMVLFTKGAADVLLDRTAYIMTGSGVRPLQGYDRQKILRQNTEFSKQGLRVLGFAFRNMDQGKTLDMESERDYTFLGLAAMMDPPRPETRAAVTAAKRAGIRPVMITGDHQVTAMAIAEQVGILEVGSGSRKFSVMTGRDLDTMTDEKLASHLEEISVYARVSPEHKIRIVRAWQERGHIIAMTGDGVNDAPALKKADVGIAMGISGTEVSKDAATMILADDNFATIMKAVANGRNVYGNIKNAIQFLLSGNMAGILCVLYTSLMALPMPFAPVHLLFINLLTDSLPAIAIGMEPADENILGSSPRNPADGILTVGFLWAVLLQGGLIGLCTMIAYYTGLYTGTAGTASTMAFTTLTLARLFHGFNCRGSSSVIRLGFMSNLWTVMAFEAGAVLLAAVMFVPGLQTLFAVADLSPDQFLTVLIFSFLPTVVIQGGKCMKEGIR